MARHNVDELLALLRTQPVRNALRQGPSLQFDQQVSRIAQMLGLDRAVLRERLLAFRAGKGLSFEGLGLEPSPTGAGPQAPPSSSSSSSSSDVDAPSSSSSSDVDEVTAAEAIARRLEAEALVAFARSDAASERVRELRAARAARDAQPVEGSAAPAQPVDVDAPVDAPDEPHTGA